MLLLHADCIIGCLLVSQLCGFNVCFLQLGRALFNHLKVYTGPTHPHEAQKPIDLPIRDKRIQMER
ncbi:hypothetical protein BDE02_01G340600 [Populus trichocarpa]|nr:hypothetical protein BDE02_01G340600 [Populus trichocarpa]